MAQGLKVGEAVSLIKVMRVGKKDPAYAQGLKQLNAGQMGHVVEISSGRSVVIEFNGKRITLPSRRLQRAVSPTDIQAETGKKRRGRPPMQRITLQAANTAPSEQSEAPTVEAPLVPQETTAQTVSDLDAVLYSAINYDDLRFIISHPTVTNHRDES